MLEEEDGEGRGGKADLKQLAKVVDGDKVGKVGKVCGLRMSLLA